MKKLLVLATFLLFSVVSTVNAYTIGNDVTARPAIDTATNFTMIDTNLMFTEDGFIDSWSFWAAPSDQSVGTIYLQTFKFLGGYQYKLTGQNVITGASLGLNNFSFLPENQIAATAGEYIGWTTSEGTIPFTYINGIVANYPGSVVYDSDAVTSVGQFFNTCMNDPNGLDRIYSISADVAPVPEPSTLLLLGSGLAGLAFWRKRK